MQSSHRLWRVLLLAVVRRSHAGHADRHKGAIPHPGKHKVESVHVNVCVCVYYTQYCIVLKSGFWVLPIFVSPAGKYLQRLCLPHILRILHPLSDGAWAEGQKLMNHSKDRVMPGIYGLFYLFKGTWKNLPKFQWRRKRRHLFHPSPDIMFQHFPENCASLRTLHY